MHIWFECFPTLFQPRCEQVNMTTLQAKTMGLDAAGLFRTIPSATSKQVAVKSKLRLDY